MTRSAESGRTGSKAGLAGRVTGAVLKALRAHVGLSQELFAERLQVAKTTVQAWESGRRPLINTPFTELQRVRRLLQTCGAVPNQLAVWDQALTADTILADIGSLSIESHPLALVVPDRTLTELLAWPLSGVPPQRLSEVRAELPIETGVRAALAADLRRVVDRSTDGLTAAMLRRQAKYLVANHEPSQDWLADVTARDVRRVRSLQDWTPDWAVFRSHAVSAAVAGDLDPLTRFVREGLATDRDIAANLNYWAYWVGEIGDRWTSDTDMLNTDQAWSGQALLDSLLKGLEHAPYRELCAHTLWALLRCRRSLIDNPSLKTRIRWAIDAVTSKHQLVSDQAKHRLEQVAYLAGS
ncbi:hypothetical protein GCM10012275_46600 [Longimycelium tulufanense]|uniref:HTH cro/C1-type domain-containing protein n=1 Tax=Longimycelium tulufanense TaxID=907463 RepID=A0A8J3CI45_9PSEU|nr:helix-turn-helix domain-containing protein [Longimycelium tulufanense]GGM70837.1 hypothetical protein GCM10012275_46600 [Longimycelium tulufanense]